MKSLLQQLHIDIDNRVQAIRADYPAWLCRAGCDGCCHRLAEIPRLTVAEWHYLQEGLSALPLGQQQDIAQKITALAEQTSRPLVCPLLDLSAGVCRVYSHRPVACRTYGFYVQRDQGLYCQEIKMRVEMNILNTVVWGNHEAIDYRLSQLGETRELTEWFAHGHES